MYTIVRNYGSDVDVLGNFTNLKNLDIALRMLEEQARKNWTEIENADYSFNSESELPQYKELVKIFKDRKNCARIRHIVNDWLVETCSPNMGNYDIEILFIDDNRVFNL
ncbi:hypothetical protein [Pseudoalteromonas phage J2-1_QLiu-2017]|nr:hypothetical protein [Pseudoalteromonas phage J2-1_QLiu-2017]